MALLYVATLDPVQGGNLNGTSAAVSGAIFRNFPHILSRKVAKSEGGYEGKGNESTGLFHLKMKFDHVQIYPHFFKPIWRGGQDKENVVYTSRDTQFWRQLCRAKTCSS